MTSSTASKVDLTGFAIYGGNRSIHYDLNADLSVFLNRSDEPALRTTPRRLWSSSGSAWMESRLIR